MNMSIKKVFAGAIMAVACFNVAVAANVTLTAGAQQYTTFSDPAGSGKQVTLSVGAMTGHHLELSNGTGTLGGIPTTSVGGFVGELNSLKSTLSATGAVVNSVYALVGGRVKTSTRALIAYDVAAQNATFDYSAVKLLEATSGGVLVISTDPIPGICNGGEIAIRNMRVDYSSKSIYGDVEVIRGGVGGSMFYPNAAIWTYESIVGNLTIPVRAMADNDLTALQQLGYMTPLRGTPGVDFSTKIVISGLKVTPSGLSYFADGLGLTVGSVYYNVINRFNTLPDGWGIISLDLRLKKQ